MELTDEQITGALIKGDEKAFEHLFRTFYSRLCTYATSILNDDDEAEEVVQQVFLKLWEKRMELQIVNSFKSYLYRTVHNACLNKIKHLNVRRQYADEVTFTSAVSADSTGRKIAATELETRINHAIDKLPEQCRLVFKLSRFEELKYSEIAAHLNISIKTVENHMGKALKIMREELKDYLPLIAIILPWILN